MELGRYRHSSSYFGRSPWCCFNL